MYFVEVQEVKTEKQLRPDSDIFLVVYRHRKKGKMSQIFHKDEFVYLHRISGRRSMDSYRQFLEEFVPSHPVELAESESMPFRMQVFYLNDDDLDAELQDWSHQYLSVL